MVPLTNIMIVSEDILLKGLKYFGGHKNKFKTALYHGEKYKDAMLTPVYLYNVETDEITVTSEECLKRLYN